MKKTRRMPLSVFLLFLVLFSPIFIPHTAAAESTVTLSGTGNITYDWNGNAFGGTTTGASFSLVYTLNDGLASTTTTWYSGGTPYYSEMDGSCCSPASQGYTYQAPVQATLTMAGHTIKLGVDPVSLSTSVGRRQITIGGGNVAEYLDVQEVYNVYDQTGGTGLGATLNYASCTTSYYYEDPISCVLDPSSSFQSRANPFRNKFIFASVHCTRLSPKRKYIPFAHLSCDLSEFINQTRQLQKL